MSNYYHTLEIQPSATQAEIKKAYRRLAKLFHPDSQLHSANHDKIIKINAAYEVLSDPKQRQSYDQQLYIYTQQSQTYRKTQDGKARKRQRGSSLDAELHQWLSQVYQPINSIINQILEAFQPEVDELSADPFDDELMEAFQTYVQTSKEGLEKAQRLFRSIPNPANVAGVAAHLYYSLNHVEDGLEDLNFFTLNYEDSHLHTGQEFFSIAFQMQQEAQARMKSIL
ncbi:MAG: DnaJ domain-containing protein [Microcoleaceae cyanobacterium]